MLHLGSCFEYEVLAIKIHKLYTFYQSEALGKVKLQNEILQ